ncbi:uncharacterized protein isoform X1 [Choristoneura fumiferana]|uniref:uncharacterized protein isoform X1 n=1 Tax=Choristoneura fumiferana TaxID=7141 RepID=UPI003D156CE6
MYKQFPLSMENIPRHSGFGCLSLKFGSIFSALIVILYSVLALAQCLAAISVLPTKTTPDDYAFMLTYGLVVTVTIVHSVTFLLTAIMLVGVLRERPRLIRPWVIWTSLQVTAYILLFIFFTTINMINNFADNSLPIYFIEFLSLLLRAYMLVLVASYYKQLEEERDERLKSLISKDIWYETA